MDQDHRAVQVDLVYLAVPTHLVVRQDQADRWGLASLKFQVGLVNQDCLAILYGQVVAVVLIQEMRSLQKVLEGNRAEDIHIVRTMLNLCRPSSLEHIASVRSIFRSADWRQKGSTQAVWRLLPKPARAIPPQSDQEFKVPPKGYRRL